MFNTTAEADQKLMNTVVFYKDSPVVCGGSSGRENKVLISLRELANKQSDWKNVAIFDENLDMKNVGSRLGYINCNIRGVPCTMYSRRSAIRKAHSTQGLSNENVLIDASPAFLRTIRESYSHRFFEYEHNGLKDTLINKYPTMNSVKRAFSQGSMFEMAFNRYLSISKDTAGLFKVNYKNTEIGWTEDFERFNVSKPWKYLDELFEETNMKVRFS
jgi:hypothetical protein